MKKYALTLLLLFSAAFSAQSEQARFASIFSDNMVLQQQQNVQIWGYGTPNETLTLSASWLKTPVDAKADDTGKWSAALPTPKGSLHPETLTLKSSDGSEQKLSNVLIGEVWLCSGQSNMEMILMSQPDWNLIVEHSPEELSQPENPYVRFVNIQRKETFSPMKEVWTYGWKTAQSNDLKWLSAVAWFFGKKVAKELQVPVGLIVSSYGGSPVQSWIPEETVLQTGRYEKERLVREAELKASKQSEADYINAMTAWVKESEQKTAGISRKAPVNLMLPVNFENSSVGNQMGECILTREMELKPEQMGQDLHLSLGTLDDLGQVFFNGALVWSELRNSKSYSKVVLTIPAEKLKTGINRLEVRVLNVLWGGGLTGPASEMHYTLGNGCPVSLTGEWYYSKIFDLYETRSIPREGKPLLSTLSSLYNGMIHPLAGFTLKGCLWYQGEENVREPSRYPDMLSDMITAWRERFYPEMPFYYVQIAPYKYDGSNGVQAPEMWEAQASIERKVPHTAMVVTLDLGNPENIHPAKKMEVGERLANLALDKTYGLKRDGLFPQVSAVSRQGNVVCIKLLNTYQGMKISGGQPDVVLSEDQVHFFPAKVEAAGDCLRVVCDELKQPRFIRYAWKNTATASLYNSVGLPLSSFRAEISH